jgi:hypothetical protein
MCFKPFLFDEIDQILFLPVLVHKMQLLASSIQSRIFLHQPKMPIKSVALIFIQGRRLLS